MFQRVVSVSARRVLGAVAGIGVVLAGTFVDVATAEARGRHRRHVVRHQPAYSPPYASIVVDANTGRVLHATNENEHRHPASITKVMTLYLLFEQIEKGRIRLDGEIPVSAHAASMAPSKLGLRPGSMIGVEDAIMAVVTKSANDIAVAIAEAVGGDEDRFAEMMTAKARSLGMSRTHFANASGLPDPEQITTARDLSILGRAIQERFPRQFAYFSRHNFAFRGQVLRNHNRLLGRVEGVDGIKTGYTRASGFNLLTSARLGNRRIVTVVLGGRSGGARDRIVADLVDKHLESASPTRVASVLPDNAASERAEPAERREAAPPRAEQPRPVVAAVAPPPPRPEPQRALAFAMPTAAAAALAQSNGAPMLPSSVIDKPRPAVVAAMTRTPDDKVASIPERRQVSLDGSTRPVAASATSTPATPTMRWVAGPQGQTPKSSPSEAARSAETVRVAKTEPAKSEPAKPAAARSGFVIQIGATDEAGKAQNLIARAKSGHSALAGATGFTEKVQKGHETLWRARFAGLSEAQAGMACKQLKRSGFACFTAKN